jgi:uncharacterized coiled-coil protein SlyX
LRIADPPPSHCSACFAQNPGRTHVDFNVSWDGPVIPGGVMGEDGELHPGPQVTIDDLIICEPCLRRAAELIGLVDPQVEQDHLDELDGQLQELKERLAGQAGYIDKLEKAAEARGRLQDKLTAHVRAVTPQGPPRKKTAVR